MRKINLKSYQVEVPQSDGTKQKVTIDVKDWISNAIFHPDLKLGGREVILRGKLVEKLEKAGDEILLELVDYKKVKDAFETIKGFGKIHIEMLRRVLEAEDVEVEEKKKPK